MEVTKQLLEITKNVEVHTLGNPHQCTEIWLVVHGYGQRSEYFHKHFAPIAGAGGYVVCPNAINDYYLEGYSGRVGSNWMTSHSREQAILDQLNYGNKVYKSFIEPYLKPGITFNILGFSQGAYTASRWATIGDVRPDSLICWAGVPANECYENPYLERLKNIKMAVALGDADELLTPQIWKQFLDSPQRKQLNFAFFPFNGTHKMNTETLDLIRDWLI